MSGASGDSCSVERLLDDQTRCDAEEATRIRQRPHLQHHKPLEATSDSKEQAARHLQPSSDPDGAAALDPRGWRQGQLTRAQGHRIAVLIRLVVARRRPG